MPYSVRTFAACNRVAGGLVCGRRRQERLAGGTATRVDERIWAIDLGFQGWDRVVYAYLLAAPDELALIETGPTSTLPALYAGIEAAGFDPAQLTKIFVSHIHLDHSGGAGAIVREQPDVQVFVHPIGAPHLIDPARLVSSAGSALRRPHGRALGRGRAGARRPGQSRSPMARRRRRPGTC